MSTPQNAVESSAEHSSAHHWPLEQNATVVSLAQKPTPSRLASQLTPSFMVPVLCAFEVLLVTEDEQGHAVGTVQLVLAMPDNQPHRADVAKMLVHRSARRRGVARRLMHAVEEVARDQGRTLLVLDTVTGSDADRLYTGAGWRRVGEIPGYALMPDGAPCATTVFYKAI